MNHAYQDGGLMRIGVIPYSGSNRPQKWDAQFHTWWNRELGIGGRVLCRNRKGKVRQVLVKSDGPGTLFHFPIYC
jgi:aminopeptidase I